MRSLVASLLLLIAAPASAQVAVSAPAEGAKVPAAAFGSKLVAGTLTLSGTALPNTNLPVAASCVGYDCSGATFTGADGRWTTRFQLVARRKRPKVTVRVGDAVLHVRLSVKTPAGLPAAPAPLRSNLGGTRAVVMVGDSLALGTALPLQGLITDRPMYLDARVGRFLGEGMDVLARARPPRGILAFSLFTNDDPSGIERLDAAVRASVAALGEHGCAVWATIVRPKVGGRSYKPVNGRLRALALEFPGRLLLADWADAVRGHRKAWLAKDGVHATSAGYAARAQLYADAIESCTA